MDELKTEEEQVEALRAWWSEYGAYVIGGVVLGGLILFGFNYQSNARLEAQQEASALYDELADTIVDGELEEAEDIAGRIAEEYANTAYVAQSKLAMARMYMDENRDEDAVTVLRELVALKDASALGQVARLRLAKVLLYQDKAEEALDAVTGEEGDAFAARFAEARGDAFVALERYDEARSAYQAALAAPNAAQTLDQGYVRLKLLDLPESEPAEMPDVEPVETPDVEPAETTDDEPTADDEPAE